MRKIGEISAIILLLSLSRLAISIPNLEPIGAAALFGGALLSSRYLRYIVPLVALFIGDLVIALIQPTYAEHLFGPAFIAIYASFALTVLLGKYMIGNQPKMGNVIKAGVASSLIFFVVTNFASWLDPVHSIYPKNMAGLAECYIAGLAFYDSSNLFSSFFLNTLISSVGFSILVFGLYSVYQRSLKTANTPA